MPIRILIADDHQVVRMGVRTLLAAKPEWQICGEAVDGNDTIAKVRELAPDVVILDLTMPGLDGYHATKRIRWLAPSAKIILFSLHNVPATAASAGADAFVSKSSAADDLVSTIERVLGEGGPTKGQTAGR